MAMDLRARLKEWERDFSQKEGFKPTSKDIKKDAKVHALYKQYHREKAAALARSPTSKEPVETPSKSEIEPETPDQPRVVEVFPTPQLQGRVMGIFDIQLPITPERIQTPVKPTMDATPKSKQTLSYLGQRGSKIADGNSPITALPKFKTMRDMLAEKEQLAIQVRKMSEENTELADQMMPAHQSSGEEDDGQVSPTEEAQKRQYKSRKTMKRQTKRVAMRPVNENDGLSRRKATENYRSLNIKKKKFRKR